RLQPIQLEVERTLLEKLHLRCSKIIGASCTGSIRSINSSRRLRTLVPTAGRRYTRPDERQDGHKSRDSRTYRHAHRPPLFPQTQSLTRRVPSHLLRLTVRSLPPTIIEAGGARHGSFCPEIFSVRTRHSPQRVNQTPVRPRSHRYDPCPTAREDARNARYRSVGGPGSGGLADRARSRPPH